MEQQYAYPRKAGDCAIERLLGLLGRARVHDNIRANADKYAGRAMFEYLLRFIAGGIAVSAFAALSDGLRPKSFAGLFGAAPSIALATLVITLAQKGAPFAAAEGQTMIFGACALAAYSWTVCLLLKKAMWSSSAATLASLIVWFAVAFCLSLIGFALR